MSAQKRKEEINLLPEKGFESTTTGRILAWILTTFRIIVIVTEIIVMVAFLSRFWLDAQNSDLNDKIKQREAVLSASLGFEKQFKSTQKRLKIFSDLVSNKTPSMKTMEKIAESLPSDVVLTSVIVEDTKVEINGATPNEKSIQQLAVNLNSKTDFSKFSITEIGNNLENFTTLDFTLEGLTGN